MPHNATPCRLAIASTYLPRQCGLATYTADLREAIGVATSDVETVVVAIDRDGLRYGDEVVTTIRQDQVSDYVAAAEALRAAAVDVVLIEHEYGIFGGPDGSHVLELARALTTRGVPYLVTLHTVLSKPSPGQAATLRALCAGAARVTVFTETARRVAIRTGIANSQQLAVVPHGAPVALRAAPALKALRPGIADLVQRIAQWPTLTTFGLLSDGKGIDVAIEALADVVRAVPEARYVVAGATHPEIKRRDGEAYRDSLRAMVSRLGLDRNVIFVDAFLSPAELSAILHASTIFVTPYRSPEQTCSGALTFALAAGLPVVSTSYRYAEDMLAAGAGRIVPCGDPVALAAEIRDLLADPEALHKARTAAEEVAAWLPWPTVAAREADLVREVAAGARRRAARTPHSAFVAPMLVLDHLDRLTDEIGILQFAAGAEPDKASGYCVDDVARLAIVATDLLAAGYPTDSEAGRYAYRWLRQCNRFLHAAYDPSGAMFNQLSYSGVWEDWPHFGDHVGRAIWSLGVMAGTPEVPHEVRHWARELLAALSPHPVSLPEAWLRTAAYSLIGLARAGRVEAATPLVHRLDAALRATAETDPTWYWFEPELTYDNARLPQALLAGAIMLDRADIAARALRALDWYAEHVGLPGGMLRCVGNVWHRRDDSPERWHDDGDEQPIDAAALAEAFADAWRYRGDAADAQYATTCFGWFLGRNRAHCRVYVDRTGACHDGLATDWVNGNQGAESTLAYYQALLGLVRAGLARLPELDADLGAGLSAAPGVSAASPSGATITDTGIGRTLTGRTGVTRANPPDRSPTTTSRVRPHPTGHRTRTTEGHPDAR